MDDSQNEAYERTFKVAGVTYYQENISKVSELTPVPSIEREPDNNFDKNAIKVLLDDHHVGYVPGYLAKTMSKKMDNGEELTVEFVDWNTSSHVDMVGITITVKEK